MEENTSIPNTALETAKTEIEAILKKYNLVLVPIVVHQGDRTFSRIDIAPVQEATDSVPTDSVPTDSVPTDSVPTE